MMQYFRSILSRRTDDGASAVEYGLLVAAIAAVVVGIVFSLGGVISGAFKSTCDKVAGTTNAAASCTNG